MSAIARSKGAKPPAKIDPLHALCGLTVREARFIDIYLSTFAIGRSYIEAGFKTKTPESSRAAGSRLLTSVNARRYLAQQSKAMFARVEEEQDRLLLTLTGVAFADPNELVEFQRGACRYCHGRLKRYQYTPGEWQTALEMHKAKREKAMAADRPDPGALEPKGGVGYDFRKAPHPDCCECWGHGVGKLIVKDTRNLSPAALALYAGVEKTKDGLKINMHSQEKARDLLAKIHKLTEEGTNINLTFDSAVLGEKYADVMAKAHAKMAAMREDRDRLREERGDGLHIGPVAEASLLGVSVRGGSK